ncbi:hypothetical protein FHG87_012338 [Trinorchestia longiramus]|nr:hypothetical protein FHG87_012338 [Trinorchestia longiramus]
MGTTLNSLMPDGSATPQYTQHSTHNTPQHTQYTTVYTTHTTQHTIQHTTHNTHNCQLQFLRRNYWRAGGGEKVSTWRLMELAESGSGILSLISPLSSPLSSLSLNTCPTSLLL